MCDNASLFWSKNQVLKEIIYGFLQKNALEVMVIYRKLIIQRSTFFGGVYYTKLRLMWDLQWHMKTKKRKTDKGRSWYTVCYIRNFLKMPPPPHPPSSNSFSCNKYDLPLSVFLLFVYMDNGKQGGVCFSTLILL